jgi:hypothetical protein
VLEDEGSDTDDEALISLPFEFEYSPELLAKLGR